MSVLRLRRSLRRHGSTYLRALLVFFATILIWDTYWLSSTPPPERASLSQELPPEERYFIASIHWNNEAILRARWIDALLDLVKHLGPEKTYVSILESGSWDNTKGALRELDAKLTRLGAPHNIVLDDTTHKDEISRNPSPNEEGWIWTPRGRKELRRIPYLSRLRNTVMADMMKTNRTTDQPFSKIIWLNDVVFTTEDVLTLLNTRSGKFAAACSLDFSKPPLFYDTFALRDINGEKPVTQTWPYFLSSASRRALVANQPVPVRSCWNGVVAMDARPFYENPPLKFRGIPDSLASMHLEGSECCLIHADNPYSSWREVFLNPNVRVGYNPAAYEAVEASSRRLWPPVHARLKGLWYNRVMMVANAPRRAVEHAVVQSRLHKWRSHRSLDGEERKEKGAHCLINEMQVLVENGWAHL